MGGFIKFANESEDVRNWIIKNFGNEFLAKYTKFEDMLPLMVIGDKFIASHTVPPKIISKEDIVSREPKAAGKDVDESGHHRGLMWTDNTAGQSSKEAIEGTLKNVGKEGATWVIGHRSVHENEGKYREQFDGKLIQMNNQKEEVYAIIPADGAINPERDIHKV